MKPQVTFHDLCGQEPPDNQKPPLDRQSINQQDLSQDQKFWRDNGYLILKDFVPNDLVDEYCRRRSQLDSPGGWKADTPYLHVPQLRDLALYRPLTLKLKELIGDEMGLHLNLTGWISTERNWHQDDYLNPDFVNSWYAAVWFALDSIHADSGPFEFVPGSHKWPLTRRDKVLSHLTPEQQADPMWPAKTQDWVSQAFEEQIQATGAHKKQFLGEKGDVLIWHGRLAHRGTKPNVPGKQRKSLISHYSAISKRQDMPQRARHPNGSYYFVFNHPLR